jgi:hypothetical protein
MSPCEAAWVAGIVDGEGSITIRTKPYPGGKRYQVASLSVCNTDTELLARVVEFTGIGRIGFNIRANHKRKEIWRWQTDQRQAAAVVEQLMPWLTCKRRVAELLLEFQTLRRCGKFFPGAEERQRGIVEEVRACNQRGSGAPD